MGKKKNRVYLAEIGDGEYKTFDNWPDCESFVKGRNIRFAGGATEPEALAKVIRSKSHRDRKAIPRPARSDLPTEGICSDAGTRGNPGPSEYRIADLEGLELEHRMLGIHSNNYAELAGIGAMVQYAIRRGHSILWTDSKIAIGWIQTGRVGIEVHERPIIIKMAGKIRALLCAHPNLELRKWKTKAWGEIPADFGRK